MSLEICDVQHLDKSGEISCVFRFEEQLQRWLVFDPLDSVPIPLFVPSTLLSIPEILVPKQHPSVSAASITQVDKLYFAYLLLP